MLADFNRGEGWKCRNRTAETHDHCAVAGHWQSGGWALRDQSHHQERRLVGGCFRSRTGGMHPVAGGNRRSVHRDRGRRDRGNRAQTVSVKGESRPDETTVLCITGNGLKTTDALAGKYEVEEPDRAQDRGVQEVSGADAGRAGKTRRKRGSGDGGSLSDRHRSNSNGAAPADRGQCAKVTCSAANLDELFTALDQQVSRA